MSDAGKVKIATALFDRGSKAVQTGDFEFAVDCFLKCARLVPDKVLFRQSLRGAEYKLYKNNKKGAAMAGARMATSRMKLKAAKTRKKWNDVIEAAEDCLRVNPWDTLIQLEIATACRELDLIETGIWVLEAVTLSDKTNADVYRLLAEFYEDDSQFDKAINALSMVQKVDPKDHEAGAKMRQLAASDTIKKHDEGTAVKGRSESADDDVFEPDDEVPDTPENRARKEIALLEAKTADTPDNINLFVQIADGYRRIEDFEKAVENYVKAIELAGNAGAPEIKAAMLDCRIDPLRKSLGLIKQRWEQRDPTAAEAAQKLRQQYNKYQSEILRREIELYRFKTQYKADDYAAHFELGSRYRQVGMFDEAIVALQKGRNDARRKWESLCWLGFSFWKKKNHALAETNLKASLEALPVTDEEAKKLVTYFRGAVAEDRGDTEAAIEHFNDIAAIDYAYKDVAARLDKLNAETG